MDDLIFAFDGDLFLTLAKVLARAFQVAPSWRRVGTQMMLGIGVEDICGGGSGRFRRVGNAMTEMCVSQLGRSLPSIVTFAPQYLVPTTDPVVRREPRRIHPQ